VGVGISRLETLRRRQTRATRCITPIALYTKLDAECDKQATVVGLLLTLADGGQSRRGCFTPNALYTKVDGQSHKLETFIG